MHTISKTSLFAMLVFLLFANQGQAVTHPDYNALVALYNSTNGDTWTDNTGWLSNDDPCSGWNGVECEGGRVTVISLQQNNLTGTLPNEIGDLTQLRAMYLWGNSIGGNLPNSIGNLTNLNNIWLFQNQLTGEIPASIGNLSQMYSLKLENNQMSGPLPSSLGNLTQLWELNLSNNQFSGTLPQSIGNLTALNQLRIGNNQLTGSIPNSIGNLEDLVGLYLFKNMLTGPIPSEIEMLSNLKAVYLYDNQLSGSIPSGIGDLGLLELFVYNNQLAGCFPGSLSNLCGISLNFNNNQGLPNNGNVSSFCDSGFGGDFDSDGFCKGIDDCDDSDPNLSGNHVWNGHVFITNQQQLDDFSSCYSVINGNLTIRNSVVNNFDNLVNLEEVTGNVYIRSTSANDMSGLDNLNYIGGYLKVQYNYSMTSLSGLENLSSVGGYLRIDRNRNLSDCCAIYALLNAGVGGSIYIARNDSGCDNVGQIENYCSGSNPLLVSNGDNNISGSGNTLSNLETWPNPNDGDFNIFIPDDFMQGQLELINGQGQTVWQRKLGADENYLNVQMKGQLSTGLYFLRIHKNGESDTRKILVN